MTNSITTETANSNGNRNQPRYFATESATEAGVYRCPAYGNLQYSESQLRAWARRIGAEVVLVGWRVANETGA